VFDSFRFPIVPWTFEDLGFFLDAAHRTTRVVFSSKVKVTYGVGAIAAAQGWKSNLQLRRELCYSQHFHNVVRRYPLTDAQKNLVQAALNTHIDGFAATFLALCRNGIMPDLAITREFVKLNPRVVSNAASLLAARLLRGKGAQTESHSNR
jgi:hypothetical protein